MSKNFFQDIDNKNLLNYAFFKHSNKKIYEAWKEKSDSYIKISRRYEEAERDIQNMAEKQNDNNKIEDFFEGKRIDQYNKEKTLAEQMFGINKYPGLDETQEQIDFWTSRFDIILDENSNQKDENYNEKWLATVFKSKEFAEKMGGKSDFVAFYRSYIGSKEVSAEDVEKEIEKELSKNKKEGTLTKGIVESIVKTFNKELGLKDNELDSLETSLNSIVENSSNFTDFKKTIKNQVKEELKNKNQKSKQPITTLKIYWENNNQPFLIVDLNKEDGGALAAEKTDNFIDKFSGAAKQVIKDLFSSDSASLSIGFGRTISLNKNDKALAWLDEEISNKKEDIEKIIIRSTDKSSVNGFLGEFARLYSNIEITLTGYEYDTIQKNGGSKNIGKSFSDATFQVQSNNKNTLIGLNIKHYVSDFNSDSIEIYKSKKGISIYNDYIRRYIPEDDIKLIRFVDMNYNLFSRNKSIQSYKGNIQKISCNYLDNFIRITSAAKENFKNYFFVINNMYIPTSYIYKTIVDYLKNNQLKDMFSVLGNPQEIRTRRRPSSPDNLLIDNIEKKNTLKIQFNGIRIKGLRTLL